MVLEFIKKFISFHRISILIINEKWLVGIKSVPYKLKLLNKWVHFTDF